MAITNFIPTIWSETLYSELNKNFVAVNHCNRDFEGDIKSKGSTVNICGVGEITIKDYTKNVDMNNPQELDDSVTKLVIDQAKFFNFQIDDVDRAQSTPKLMEAAMKKAAEAIANEADKYVFSLYSKAGASFINNTGTTNLYDTILEARQHLYENNVGDNVELFLEVSPKVAARLLREKILLLPSASDNSFATGYLGSIFGCKVFVCNNISISDNGGSNSNHCIIRTKRAIAFADQLSEVEAYRPEKRFADAVKGLHLYGAKVVYPNEMVCISVRFETTNEPV